MTVRWSSALMLGDVEIDAQHRELFRRFEALVEAMDGGSATEVALLLEFLREYVVLHFAAEERVMRETGYPGATVHAAAHDRFVREFRELQRLHEVNGATIGVAVKTRTWIQGWLESHIAGVDRALACHLRGVRSHAVIAPRQSLGIPRRS